MWHQLTAWAASVLLLAAAVQTAESQLIGHYPLDQINAGATPDTTTLNGAGTVNNGTGNIAVVGGKIGNAFSFEGPSDEFVGINDAAFGKSAFSASVWFLPTGSTDNQGSLSNWGSRTILIRTGGTTLETFVRNSADTAQLANSGTFTGESVVLNEFQHAVLTFDGQTLIAYLNGVKSNSAPAFGGATTIGPSGGTMAIGGRGGSEENMTGLIDDVSLWGEVLTDGEARALFTLANTSQLNYDASEAAQLFQVFDGSLDSALIDDLIWVPDSGLGGVAGDVVLLPDGNFFLNLDGTAGVVSSAVPEAASIAIWALLALVGCAYFRLRRKS